MDLSVIVPVHNDGAGLRKLVPALCHQEAAGLSYEIIIVDNNSDDDTLEVARTLAQTCREGKISDGGPADVLVIQETARQSAYAARNAGIAFARGKVLAFTDADCLPEPAWLREGYRALEDNGAGLAAGRIEMTFHRARPNVVEYLDAAQKMNQKLYVEQAGFGATANLFVRAELFERYGPFRDDILSGGDYEFCQRATQAGAQIIYAEQALVQHPARATLGSKLRKAKRVAQGQKQLAALGLLKHSRLSWRRLLPNPWCPTLAGVPIAWPKRIAVCLLHNVIRYYNAFLRL